jgi:hypothetical protein
LASISFETINLSSINKVVSILFLTKRFVVITESQPDVVAKVSKYVPELE